MSDDYEDFDEHGVLKDRRSLRVPMRLMDSRADRDIIHDGRGNTDTVGHRPGYLVADTADVETPLAMADLEAELAVAYRRDAAPPANSYPLSAGVGSACSINGAPGELVRQGDWLVCKPVRQDARSARDERPAAYDAYDAELVNAWRGR